MRLRRYIRLPGTVNRRLGHLLAHGVLITGFVLAAGAATAQSSNNSASSSGSQAQGPSISNNSAQIKSAQSSAAANGAGSFATKGNLGNSGGTGGGVSRGSTLPYLASAPEMNGPGSVNWCEARSSCAQEANRCSSHCQNNTLANGTAQSDIGEAGSASQNTGDAGQPQITTNITNFSAGDCTAVCQSTYQSCSSAASNACSLSQ